MRRWITAIMLAVMTTGEFLRAAEGGDVFVPPAENVVVFRRDRLPIDVESMTELANHLMTMAKVHGGATAAKRRAVAQMLALASALQPANPAGKEFSAAYAAGTRNFDIGAQAAQAAMQRVREMLVWLGAAPPNEDSRALIDCLGDVLAASDPDHPASQKHLAAGERGPWNGWVQPVAAFSSGKIQTKIEPGPQRTEDIPKLDPTPASVLAIKLGRASLAAVIWTSNKPGGPSQLRPISIAMKACVPEQADPTHSDTEWDEESQPEPAKPFKCKWEQPDYGTDGKSDEKPVVDSWAFRRVANAAMTAVTSLCGELPSRGEAIFAPVGVLFPSDGDAKALGGSLAVLLHSAVSGNRPSGTVIAEVREDGSLHLPSDFWLRLRALLATSNGRVVVPKAAAAYLPGFLALEQPQVFFSNEILLADDLKHLIALSTGEVDAPTRTACAAFDSIRTSWGRKPVGPFVNTRAVRQQLESIAKQAPCHASARMLAIQGANQRPTKLPRPLLAAELLAVLKPADAALKGYSDIQGREPDPTALSDTIRPLVAALDRYAEIRDRDLLDTAGDIVVALRTLGRALRNKSTEWGQADEHWSDYNAFRMVHQAATGKLRAEAIKPL